MSNKIYVFGGAGFLGKAFCGACSYVVVLPGLDISDHALVGVGAVVTKSLQPGETLARCACRAKGSAVGEWRMRSLMPSAISLLPPAICLMQSAFYLRIKTNKK
jgi:hypothetical protein